MKNKLILALLLAFALLQVASAQKTFYYSEKSKVPIETLQDKYAVITLNDKQYTSLEVGILPSLKIKEIKRSRYRVSLFGSNNSADRTKLIEVLNKLRQKGIMVQPCYKNKEDLELISTIDINVKLKKAQDISVLEEYAKKNGLEVIEQNPSMPLWYLISVTSSKNGNVLEQANKMYETNLFASVAPDFSFDAREKPLLLRTLEETKLLLYPNPATDFVKLEGLEAKVEVLLFSTTGVCVLRARADDQGLLSLDLRHLAKGLYLVKAGNETIKLEVKH